MIDYVEIRNAETELIGIIDTAKSVIWRSVYYGVGDFEIYVQATQNTRDLLSVGNYVTRPDNNEIGIIEKVEIKADKFDGLMITASGRFAKSILDRRLIYNLSGTSNTATILRGNVEAQVRKIVEENAISCAFDSRRNIPLFELGALANIQLVIVDENGNAAQKQVSYGNLLEYSDAVLQEYELSARVTLDAESKKLQYSVFSGEDRSEENESGNAAQKQVSYGNLLEYSDAVLQEYELSARVTLDAERKKLQYSVFSGEDRSEENEIGNEPVIFSEDYDNLKDSAYSLDKTSCKNAALVGGEGEGTARFYALTAGPETGLARREVWVDASSISKKYKDAGGAEQTYSNDVYSGFLIERGRQSLAALKPVESFGGSLDVTSGNFVFNRDFFLGDVVTVEIERIGIYKRVRIISVTEVQDENGYTVSVDYQN